MSGAVSRCTPTTQPPPTLPVLCKQVQTTERTILGKASQNPTARKAFQSLFQSNAYKGLDDYRKLYFLKQVKDLRDPANIKGMQTLLETTPLKTVDEGQLRLIVTNLKAARNKAAVVKAYQQILTDPPFKHAALRTQLALLAKPLKGAKLTMNALVPKALHLPDKKTLDRWLVDWAKAKVITKSDGRKRSFGYWLNVATSKLKPHWQKFMKNWYNTNQYDKTKTYGQAYRDFSNGKYDKPGKSYGSSNWKQMLQHLKQLYGEIKVDRQIRGKNTPYPF